MNSPSIPGASLPGQNSRSAEEAPALRLLSLGAGVQSTTLLLLAAEGVLPRIDGAIFADTGWEPRAVYEHLDRIEEEVAAPAGIPIHRVQAGHIREDALDPEHRFASMPLFIRRADGAAGMVRRQCTAEYKLKPLKKQVRELLGYPHPARVPKEVYAEQWIGISRDEFGRAKDSGLRYLRSRFPLLYMSGAADGREGWTRADCLRYLASRGWGSTPKSACIGCPFHSNAQWRALRDEHPKEWEDAVAFDADLRREGTRRGSLRGELYLHRSCLPLARAPIARVTSGEWRERQTDVFEQAPEDDDEVGGCSPWTCRGDAA